MGDQRDLVAGSATFPESELSRLRAALGDRFLVDPSISSRAGRTLYYAFDRQTRQDVVVKVLEFDPSRYHEVADRLRQLLRSASELGRASVVAPTYMGEMEGALFYIAPLMSGGSLAQRLSSAEPMRLADVQRIISEVAESLARAHAKGLVHGSLTPDNILFGADGRARVADIAVTETLRSAGLLPGGGAAHERAFAAPEQWRGKRVDSRTDQYSLALIAYEMLTGHRRLDATGAGGVTMLDPIEIHAHAPLGRGIPLYVNEALRVALSANPALRYATISQFADALAGRAPDAASGLATHRADVAISRRMRLAPVIVGLLVVGALVVAFNPRAKTAAVAMWNGMWGRYAPPKMNVDASLSLDPGGDERQPPAPRNATLPSGVGATATEGSAPTSNTTTSGTRSTSAPSLGEAAVEPTATGRSGPEIDIRLGRPQVPAGAIPEKPPAQLSAADSSGGSQVATATGTIGSWLSRLRRSVANLISSPPPTAYVLVEVSVGSAIVTIDGIPRGTTPTVVSVGAGHHTVSVTGTSSYEPPSTGITASAGDTVRVSFRTVSPR